MNAALPSNLAEERKKSSTHEKRKESKRGNKRQRGDADSAQDVRAEDSESSNSIASRRQANHEAS